MPSLQTPKEYILTGSTTTALVLAHPGHEFRLLEWIRRERPVVHILTHGSRSGSCKNRINASEKLLAGMGAQCGAILGIASDRDFYRAVMDADTAFFATIRDTICADLIERNISTVVADGWQNYNPIHDLAYALTLSAAAHATAFTGKPITVLDYPVVTGKLTQIPAGPTVHRIELSTVDRAYKADKLASYPDIADDARALIAQIGPDALSVETLHQPLPMDQLRSHKAPPLYETYGLERVRDGHYTEVLSWTHVYKIEQYLNMPAINVDRRATGT